jgi:hypothetical protein
VAARIQQILAAVAALEPILETMILALPRK